VTITLHIDRLVLEGASFTRMDRARLGAAVQEQLAALLRDGTNIDALSAHHGEAAIRAGDATSKADGHGRRKRGATRVPAEATAAQWGDHIAQAVHAAVTHDVRPESRRASGRGPRGLGGRDVSASDDELRAGGAREAGTRGTDARGVDARHGVARTVRSRHDGQSVPPTGATQANRGGGRGGTR
jgi:hypothetical protein